MSPLVVPVNFFILDCSLIHIIVVVAAAAIVIVTAAAAVVVVRIVVRSCFCNFCCVGVVDSNHGDDDNGDVAVAAVLSS